MTKFLTELQADINKVEGYIEKKQETVDTHKLAMENAEKDLVNLKLQLKELQDEQNYRVEFAKWKEDKKENKSTANEVVKEVVNTMKKVSDKKEEDLPKPKDKE